jgi:aminopeptidase N
VACMADASGQDLSQIQHWYDYAGTPELKVQAAYDAASASYTLDIQQHVPDTPGQANKPAFLVPIVTGLVGGDGRDLAVRLGDAPEVATQHTLQLTEMHQRFVFRGVDQEPVPSLLRGFSAPVKLDFDYSDAQLMFLMANDSDGFNRWDAAQTLTRRVLLEMADQFRRGVEMSAPDGLVEAFRSALTSEQAGPALIAEVLSLPSIGYLGDFLDVVDVDSLHLARETLRVILGRRLNDELHAIYHDLQDDGPYRPTPEAIGRRSLKNRVLGFLVAAAQHARRDGRTGAARRR